MCIHTVLKSKGEYKFAKGGYVINVANDTVCMRVNVPLLALHMHSLSSLLLTTVAAALTFPCQLGGAIAAAIVAAAVSGGVAGGSAGGGVGRRVVGGAGAIGCG